MTVAATQTPPKPQAAPGTRVEPRPTSVVWRPFEAIGRLTLFTLEALAKSVRRPFRVALLIQTLFFVGVGSLGIVVLTGVFTGAVFAIQTAVAFEIFNAKSLIGGTVAMSLVRELAPSLTALMVAGRVGSAMTTELGTMRVTEQIDALETMAVDPVHYLVTPRIVACILMVPLLSMVFNAVGLGGAYIAATKMLGVDDADFFSRIWLWLSPDDIACTLVKGTVFGLAIGAVACYRGFHAAGGSRGVGLATTGTVVLASASTLTLDYVITSIWLVLFPSQGGLS